MTRRWRRTRRGCCGLRRCCGLPLCLFDTGAYYSGKYYALEEVRAGGLLRGLHELIHDIDSARVASRKIDQGGKLSMVALAGARGKLPDTVQKSTPKSTSAAPH